MATAVTAFPISCQSFDQFTSTCEGLSLESLVKAMPKIVSVDDSTARLKTTFVTIQLILPMQSTANY